MIIRVLYDMMENFTLLCIRALGLQQGVCGLFSMAAVKTKHFCACD